VLSWGAWPTTPPAAQIIAHASAGEHREPASIGIYLVIALTGVIPVAPMLFLVDYVARDLNGGLFYGAIDWVLYGIGAVAGPVIYGELTDRLRADRAIWLLYLLQGTFLVAFFLAHNLLFLAVGSLIAGTFVSGIIPLMQGWIRECWPGDLVNQNAGWSQVATMYLAGQALGGYLFSGLLNRAHWPHAPLFLLCALSTFLAIAIVRLMPTASPRHLYGLSSH
jgi:MFS family permease